MAGWVMRRPRIVVALLAALAAGLPLAPAQSTNPNVREVKPQPNIQDPDEIYGPDGKVKADSKIWVLNFRFLDPRLITVDVPKRGRKVCWYLWYQVINHTKEPHEFIPDFELVTHDHGKQRVFHDQILPTVQEQIRKIEDPTGYYNIKNSVTMTYDPIPPTKPDATPRAVTGVAIWDDVDPDTNTFSIFVTGLSNGYSEDDNGVRRRKTLQLNFKRYGDRYFQKSEEIRFEAPAQWIYRASAVTLPAKDKEKDDKGDDKRGAAAGPGLRPLLPERAAPGR